MKIAVIIPTYKCRNQILRVLESIGPEVWKIFVIDDCCPEQTGEFVSQNNKDPRVTVHRLPKNQGVGGAVMTGYNLATEAGCDILVKIDGDGQMDPKLIKKFTRPIEMGLADYTKGNRFSQLEHIQAMPPIRILGNLGLSFISKVSSGYWSLLDPTNGYTALHSRVWSLIPSQKISRRYFFESDLLFRLGLARARVIDITMESKYADEVSNLKVSSVLFEFFGKHLKNILKRVTYRYFLLDFNIATLELLFGFPLLVFGVVRGAWAWMHAFETQIQTPTGTVVLSAVTILLGFQLLLSFLNFDMNNEPKNALHQIL